MSEIHDLKPQWYVIHTYSGYENKVKNNIETIINNSRQKEEDRKNDITLDGETNIDDKNKDEVKSKTSHIHEQILEVSVPEQDIEEIKNGQKKVVKTKIYPGYVFVKMFMNDDTWYVLRNTRGVTSFVGPGSKPVALTESEVLSMGIENIVETVDFDVNDRVVVVEGPFENSEGVVREINMGKKVVTVNISIFGRETPVELSFSQIRQLD